MGATEIAVPDIGDFKDVPVIEVLVKPGDAIKKSDSLVVLESDKASMEVPASVDGVVQDVRVKVGDKVSQGSVIVTIAAAAPVAPASSAVLRSRSDERAEHTALTAVQAQHDDAQAQGDNAQPQGDNAQDQRGNAQDQRDNRGAEQQVVEIAVPDIGDFKDVPVIEVLVKPGDAIKKNDSLVVLESDKASMEVPASADGVVQDVRVKVGDKVSQGSVIVTITGAPSVASTGSAALRSRSDERAEHTALTAVQAQGDNAQAKPTPPPGLAEATKQSNGAVHASPSIRRFARELGVELQRVSPSGPNGRVTRDDVQNFVKSALSGTSAPARGGSADALGLAPWPKVDFAQFGPIERKPLSRIKKISGPNLHRNWVMIPHVTQNDDADVTDLEAFRKELNKELASSGVKVTMLAFLMKAAVAALKKYPEFNSSLDGEELVYKNYYHIGFAADTPGGLVVPVVRDADKKGVSELAKETADLAAKARDGKLSMAQMQGGTFTISSLGSIGGTYFTPIINAPEVAILGACRAATRPVWNGSAFKPRLMQPLSLSYDHRVIDGAAAARFTNYVAEVLADLRRALL